MKTTNLLILAFFYCNSIALSGQTYHPTLKENRYYDVAAFVGNPVCNYAHVERYFVNGDSTIDGKVYKKMYAHDFIPDHSGPYCPPFVIKNESYFSGILLREDTLEKRLFRYRENEEDYLLCDYSLEVGDSILLHNTYYIKIVDKELVTLENGEQRMKFNQANGEYYIEGIGSSSGVINEGMQGLGFWNENLCVKEGKQVLYGYQCQYRFIGISEIENHNFEINYQNNTLSIISNNKKVKSIIYNTLGAIVHKGNSFNYQHYINTEKFGSGLLIVKLIDDNNQVLYTDILKLK